MRVVRTFSLVLVVLASALSTACGGNEPPKFDPIGEKVAYVNNSFELRVTASDPDGDSLKFSYSSSIPDFKTRPGVEFYQDGPSALLRFTPLPDDVGQRSFDFKVSDGEGGDDTTTAFVDIKFPPSSSSPIFREPLGTGTLLDLSKTDTMKIKIVVEDPDNSDVTIDQEEPLIDGAKLDQDTGLTAWWSWTPTQQQIASTDRFVLTLSADDGQNAKVLKNYLIVLRKGAGTNCPGAAPVITHTPQDFSQITGLTLDMTATDDQGVGEPLLYYSFEDPGSPPNLMNMMQTTMLLIDGDMKNGSWGADVPNPVAGQSAGATADLYYVFVAKDDDDAKGTCDHETQAPQTGAYHVKVTNPGGQGGLSVCEPCTSDSQCGGANDNCLPLGSSGEGGCGKACTSNDDCPAAGYYCSSIEWQSVDGVSARQCIPVSYECCIDDTFDSGTGNDTLKSVENAEGLQQGTINVVSCPGETAGADEDWYVFDLAADATVTLAIAGGVSSDLALQLVDPSGNALATSNGTGSNESIEQCLTKGYYFARVYSKDAASNSYSLTFKTVDGSCAATCEDDPDEEDDGSSTARNVTLDSTKAFKSSTNVICPWDEDWYKVALISGETVYASLSFDQANDKEDLDIRFYQGTTLLTKCTETDNSACDAANGQSPDSDENFKWKAPASGTYYIVVHGWNGASNLYDICIGLNQAQCPALP